MIAVWAPGSSRSAEPAEGKGMKMESVMTEKCEEMKKEKQKMQVEMKAQDAELTAMVVTMNSAAQDKKPDLIGGVVTQLVEQRTAMHVQMAKMQEKMMKHMMGHMEMDKESMSKCPMMKEPNEESEGAHAEQHEKSE